MGGVAPPNSPSARFPVNLPPRRRESMRNGKIESGGSEERAVSPVIGVILMVAITVILAAVIAAFVLDIGPGSADPSAGVTFSEGDNDDIDVQWISEGQNDGGLWISCDDDPDTSGDANITSVGGSDSITCTDTVTVLAELDGNVGVVDTYDAS